MKKFLLIYGNVKYVIWESVMLKSYVKFYYFNVYSDKFCG